MGGAPQGAMRVASQIWQVVFASQTLQVFCLAFRKKAQYVVVLHTHEVHSLIILDQYKLIDMLIPNTHRILCSPKGSIK